MSLSPDEEMYELLGQSPLIWLQQAEFLKMSASLILDKFNEILPVPQAIPGIREQKVAFVDSFMLLMGLSFENIIKGAHTAKTPSLLIEDRLAVWRRHRKGHGISTLIRLIISVTPEEENLLQRLEEYAFWAGRYPIPTNTTQYSKAQSLRSFIPKRDPALCEKIFEQLASFIRSNATT